VWLKTTACHVAVASIGTQLRRVCCVRLSLNFRHDVAASQMSKWANRRLMHCNKNAYWGRCLRPGVEEVRKPSDPTPGLDRRSSYTRACDRLVSFRQRRVVDVPMVAAGVVGRVIRLIKRGTGAEAFDEVRIGQREGG
jgi:hypothetical protein